RRDPRDRRSAGRLDDRDASYRRNVERLSHDFRAGGLCRLKPCVNVVNGEIGQPAFRDAVEVRPDHRENTPNGFIVHFRHPIGAFRDRHDFERPTDRGTVESLRLFDVARHQLVPKEAAMRPHCRSPWLIPPSERRSLAAPITPLRTAAPRRRYFPPFDRGTMTIAMIMRLLTVLALSLGSLPAIAADAAYPPGSRIGLAPPAGMVTSKNFFGYEAPSNNAAIILLALPAQAYADLDKSVTADALKRQGVTLETREDVPLSIGKAFLVTGHQEVENNKIRKWILVAGSSALTALVTVQIPDAAKALYPDAAIRAALTTLAIRDTVPVDEQLGLLPFKVNELAGFRVGGVVPGRALMLSDAPADAPG